MNIGIIGLGIVGKSVKLAFSNKCKLYINDKELSDEAPNTKKELVKNCMYIFVGVPTPFNERTGKTDASSVIEVVEELNEISDGLNSKPIVVIKSAIVPRVVRDLEKSCKNIFMVISPEYLSERDHLHDFVNQRAMVLGGNKFACKMIDKIFNKYSICNKLCKVIYCSAQEAALVKYMENSFLAMKCIFVNQFKQYHDKFFKTDKDSKFNEVLKAFHLDERMGVFPFDYTVPGPDGDLGYGGKCLPKDIKSIISEGNLEEIDLSLLKEVNRINDVIRSDRDWEVIDGAVQR